MSKKAGKLQKTIKYRILQGDIVSLVRSTAELYRACVTFCLSVLKDHLEVLDLGGIKHQQRAMERLVHKTKRNSVVSRDVNSIAPNIPAYFRRAAINSALGIAQSWHSNYESWQGNGRKKRPPTLKMDNLQWPVFFKGMYKEFKADTVMLKLYTGESWVWRKAKISSTQPIPQGCKELSIKLLIKGSHAYLHRTVQKKAFTAECLPDRVVAVDMNIDRAVVMAVVARDGRIHKTRFIDVRADNRRRKSLLDAITSKLSVTTTVPEGAVFCKDLWSKVRHFNDTLAHVLSRQIMDFAVENHCGVIVFEHLGSLRPAKGSRSRRLNSKLMYWLKGDIYKKTEYKARWAGLWTTRINPKGTSYLCNHHHDIFNYLETGGTSRPTQRRIICSVCGYRADADFNAVVNIARKYFARDSQLKALDGDIEAWRGAIRFLSGCMNPLYSGLGKTNQEAEEATPHVSAPWPYPRQVKVL